jgi:hypothetical protein
LRSLHVEHCLFKILVQLIFLVATYFPMRKAYNMRQTPQKVE